MFINFVSQQIQEEKMTRRNNFAKRCAMIQILLLITILISFARVINAPKKLLAEPSIERTVPNFHTLESRSDDNVLATDVLVDNQNDGADGTAATKDMEEAVSENKAVLDDTKIPLKDDNPSKNENSNKTEANNNTQIIIPESCKDLEMIYSNDEEADSKWWKTVHTMKDVPSTMRKCGGSTGWCKSLQATLSEYSSMWTNAKLSCKDVCLNAKGKVEMCIEETPTSTTEGTQKVTTTIATE